MRVIVQAVKKREPFVDYLKLHIPQLEVVWDKGHGAMETFLRSCEILGQDAGIHLEDDVCLVTDWVKKVQTEIDLRPDEPIQFFSRSKYDAEEGSRYKGGGSFAYNVCYYLPAGMTAEIFQFYKTWGRDAEHPTGYDILMQDYFSANHLNYWLVVPSLVNHAPTISQISARRKRDRRSTTFTDPELRGYPSFMEVL